MGYCRRWQICKWALACSISCKLFVAWCFKLVLFRMCSVPVSQVQCESSDNKKFLKTKLNKNKLKDNCFTFGILWWKKQIYLSCLSMTQICIVWNRREMDTCAEGQLSYVVSGYIFVFFYCTVYTVCRP